MNFAVYHLDHSRDTLDCFSLTTEKLKEIQESWNAGKYKKVLVRDVATPTDIIALLERAYSSTNTIDQLWTEKFSDEDLPAGRELRSTSTSDIMQVGKKYYICMMAGWEEVKV